MTRAFQPLADRCGWGMFGGIAVHLYADAYKGHRPSLTDAVPPEIAESLIVRFADMPL